MERLKKLIDLIKNSRRHFWCEHSHYLVSDLLEEHDIEHVVCDGLSGFEIFKLMAASPNACL